MRERPIPWAYRVFFRQIGLDPDQTRTPVEQLALDRLQDGGFKTRGLPADALTIATIETGIALRAFDAGRLDGPLCIRDSAPGESLEGRPGELSHGTLVIADERGPDGLLFGATAGGRDVGRDTRRIAIAAIQVDGVPQIAVDEALWMVSATLSRRLTTVRPAVIYTRLWVYAGSARPSMLEPRCASAATSGLPARSCGARSARLERSLRGSSRTPSRASRSMPGLRRLSRRTEGPWTG